jgi:hypothetical protein
LSCTGPSLKTGSQKSWLNRPGINGRDIGSGERKNALPLLSTDGIQIDDSSASHWIQLDGFIIDKEVSPSEDALTAAVFMTLSCQRLGMGVPSVGDGIPQFSTGPGYNFWEHAIQHDQDFSTFTRTIAATLHCGLAWMIETAKTCGFPQNHFNEWREDALQYFQERFDIQDLIKVRWAASDDGRRGVKSIMRFTMWLITWGVYTVHKYPSLSPGPEAWFPVLYEGANGTKIMMFSRLTATPGRNKMFDRKPMEAFVPSCLAADGYEKIARCWLLLPVAIGDNYEDGISEGLAAQFPVTFAGISMSLESKTRIFSAKPLGQLGLDWKPLSQVKVYGPA